MSCAVSSFFKSHVRLETPPANGTVIQSPPDAWILTSEKVTSSAFASLNGLSFNITENVELVTGLGAGFDGDVGDDGAVVEVEEPHATLAKSASMSTAVAGRIVCSSIPLRLQVSGRSKPNGRQCLNSFQLSYLEA